MPGDRWQKLANLRALYGYMWAHPGKKLLFMGQEFAQERRVEPRALARLAPARAPEHAGVQALVRDLNHVYRGRAGAVGARLRRPTGFRWLEPDDADANVLAFVRGGADRRPCRSSASCNFSPVVRERLPRRPAARRGAGASCLNTDSSVYGGGGVGNAGASSPSPSPGTGRPTRRSSRCRRSRCCGSLPAGRAREAPGLLCRRVHAPAG